ncbi:MAG: hypothetical protein P8J37_03795 [Fuerstiella sp.]|nr:hypothetical protein [Fuerstiella sp.]
MSKPVVSCWSGGNYSDLPQTAASSEFEERCIGVDHACKDSPDVEFART